MTCNLSLYYAIVDEVTYLIPVGCRGILYWLLSLPARYCVWSMVDPRLVVRKCILIRVRSQACRKLLMAPQMLFLIIEFQQAYLMNLRSPIFSTGIFLWISSLSQWHPSHYIFNRQSVSSIHMRCAHSYAVCLFWRLRDKGNKRYCEIILSARISINLICTKIFVYKR